MMETTTESIVCFGLTPCIQRIIEYGSFEKGRVNRAMRVTLGIGGKGANTARMVRQLDGTPLLVGFAGGANGQLLEQMLIEEGVAFRHVEVNGETRICQTLVEEGNPETTELVEEMPPLIENEWNGMVALIRSLDLSGRIASISGKLPFGAPADAYAKICSMVAEQGGRVILDAPGEPLLRALEHKPFIVKMNDAEVLETLGGNDPLAAAGELIERGAQSVLITRGGRTAFFLDRSQSLEINPPRIDAVNPVGSGDAVTAGMAVLLSLGAGIEEALVHGMACGAANALNLKSGVVKLEDIDRLRGEMQPPCPTSS